MATGQLMLQSFYEERERQLRLHGAHHAAEVAEVPAAAGLLGPPIDGVPHADHKPAQRACMQQDLGPGEGEGGSGHGHLALDVSDAADGHVHAVVDGSSGGSGAKSGSCTSAAASGSWGSGSSGGPHPLAAPAPPPPRAQAPAWLDGQPDRVSGGASAAASPASPASPLGGARTSWGSGELRQSLQRNAWADPEAGEPLEGSHDALRRPAVQPWRAPGPARQPASGAAQAPRNSLRDPPASELAFVVREALPAGGSDAPSDWV